MRDTKERTGSRQAGEDWRNRGACLDQDPDLFFPTGYTKAAMAQTAAAIAVCATCPVLGPCQQWALTTREQFGVWGGLSEQDRRAILRSRAAVARQAAHPTLPRDPRRPGRAA